MAYLLVSILILTYPVPRIVASGIIQANRDIFLGVYNPKTPKKLGESVLVFKSDDEKRIEALEFIFRKLFEREGIRSKWVVQTKRDLKNYVLIVPPQEVLGHNEE